MRPPVWSKTRLHTLWQPVHSDRHVDTPEIVAWQLLLMTGSYGFQKPASQTSGHGGSCDQRTGGGHRLHFRPWAGEAKIDSDTQAYYSVFLITVGVSGFTTLLRETEGTSLARCNDWFWSWRTWKLRTALICRTLWRKRSTNQWPESLEPGGPATS